MEHVYTQSTQYVRNRTHGSAIAKQSTAKVSRASFIPIPFTDLEPGFDEPVKQNGQRLVRPAHTDISKYLRSSQRNDNLQLLYGHITVPLTQFLCDVKATAEHVRL